MSAPAATKAESHLSYRTGWLRAAVLGANDGIVSTAGLVLGVAARRRLAQRDRHRRRRRPRRRRPVDGRRRIRLGQLAARQRAADIGLEKRELRARPRGRARGADPHLRASAASSAARPPGRASSSRRGDALAAHARDELGFDESGRARPFQAAWTSALSFTSGALLPLIAIGVSPSGSRVAICVIATLLALAGLGYLGAVLGGAPRLKASTRVVGWGALAMAVTYAIGTVTGSLV